MAFGSYEIVENEKNIYTIAGVLGDATVLVHAKLHQDKEPWWEIAVNPVHYSAAGSHMCWRVEYTKEEARETIVEMTNNLIEGFNIQ